MLKPRDTQSVTSQMLKRDLESVRRELRYFTTGEHDNKRENEEGEMTADQKITHEATELPHMIRDARRVSSCEE